MECWNDGCACVVPPELCANVSSAHKIALTGAIFRTCRKYVLVCYIWGWDAREAESTNACSEDAVASARQNGSRCAAAPWWAPYGRDLREMYIRSLY